MGELDATSKAIGELQGRVDLLGQGVKDLWDGQERGFTRLEAMLAKQDTSVHKSIAEQSNKLDAHDMRLRKVAERAAYQAGFFGAAGAGLTLFSKFLLEKLFHGP